jgi:hypothetical protein
MSSKKIAVLGYRDYLRSRFMCVLDNPNVVVFDGGLTSH